MNEPDYPARATERHEASIRPGCESVYLKSSHRISDKRVGCLLIHGFTGSPWSFNEMGEFLYQRGVSVRVPLLSGHGTSSEDMEGVRWLHWFFDVRRSLNQLKSENDCVFVAGHSVGGALALYLASVEEVAGVITISAPLKLRHPLIGLIPLLRWFKKSLKKKSRSLKETPAEAGYRCYPLGGVMEVRRLLKALRRNLSQIEAPLLVMHARGDHRIDENQASDVLNGVESSDKKLMFLDHPCHTVMKGQDQDRVQHLVLDFILRNIEG